MLSTASCCKYVSWPLPAFHLWACAVSAGRLQSIAVREIGVISSPSSLGLPLLGD